MRTLVATLLSLSSVYAFASDNTEPLSAEIELGLLMTNGNTKSNSVYGKAKVSQDFENWKNAYVLKSLYKKDRAEIEVDGETVKQEQTTAHSMFASIKSDYKLDSKHKSLFVFGSYENDRFSGFDYQATLAAGYSDRLFNTDNSHFDYSVGPGVAFTKTSIEYNDDGSVSNDSEEAESAVLHVSLAYVYNISENAKFTQGLVTDIALESNKNSKAVSETAVVATINKSFAMKASYTVNYNSEVRGDKLHSDSQTAITLVFNM